GVAGPGRTALREGRCRFACAPTSTVHRQRGDDRGPGCGSGAGRVAAVVAVLGHRHLPAGGAAVGRVTSCPMEWPGHREDPGLFRAKGPGVRTPVRTPGRDVCRWV